MGLNDMNGRIQDAVAGRFLPPDPYIPDVENTQSFNRYSYVLRSCDRPLEAREIE